LPIDYTANNSKDSNKTIKAFLANFVSDDFFEEIINLCVYPSDFGISSTGNNETVVQYIRNFLIDLDKTINNLKPGNIQNLKSNINMSKTILNVREYGNTVLTIDNVQNHVPNLGVPQQNILLKIKKSPISDDKKFGKKLEKIIYNIQVYYEVCSISSGILEFDQFSEYALSNNVSVYEATKTYKEKVINLYNDLNKLQSLNSIENEKDYYIISDKESVKELSETLVNYISESYSSFKTGYQIIDHALDGLESASLYLISAPSNHGKSIFMSNIFHQLVSNNHSNFESTDAVIFITLEDDIRKLTRRLCSIFGNFEQEAIKNMYLQGYECMNANEGNNEVKNKFKEIMNNVITTSIYSKSKDKVQLIVKHCNENVFSAGDLSRFIDTIKVERGVTVKMVIIDYLDVMSPTMGSNGDTYEKQGIITQELRALTRNHKLPVLTATQNKRDSENPNYRQSNNSIGDSYLKVRYSDFILMCRMDTSKDPFSSIVQNHCFSQDHYINKDQINPKILKLKDQICQDLIPFECEITKSKEAGKGTMRFMLFCSHNLKIYDNIQQYLDDMPKMKKKSKKLQSDIDILQDMSLSSVGDDYFDNYLSNVIDVPNSEPIENSEELEEDAIF